MKTHKNNRARDLASERADNFLGRWVPGYFASKADGRPDVRLLRALSRQFGLHVKATQARARRKAAALSALVVLFAAFTVGCGDNIPAAVTPPCPAGLVVQANLCDDDAHVTCLKAGNACDAPSMPLAVEGCSITHVPAEGVTVAADCVAVCP